MIMLRNNVSIFNDSSMENSFRVFNQNDFLYALYIPRAHAREESNEWIRSQEAVKEMNHYTIYLFRQTGSFMVRRDTYLLLELPSGRKVRIVLYMDGGIGWAKDERVYVLREYDKIDRRIILGFCRKYQEALVQECHSDDMSYKRFLSRKANMIRISNIPKKIKQGSTGNDRTEYYKKLNNAFEHNGEVLDYCDESVVQTIFDSVMFI